MKKRYRVIIFILAYILIILIGIFYAHRFSSELSSKVFENSRLSVRLFLDDFIVVEFSCPGEKTNVSFLVYDEYGNLWHNSSYRAKCDTYNEIDLQGSPGDYATGRKYMVYATFNNETINSGYFEINQESFMSTARKEFASFFSFMIYQNRLARGSYCDMQRLLWVDTKEVVYGRNYILCHGLGLLSTFNILLAINIIIWIVYWIYKLANQR